jgi:CheY-like chemotaxis protein
MKKPLICCDCILNQVDLNVDYSHVNTVRFMIIEDEKDLLFVYKKGLEETGITIVAFEDPQMALNDFKKNFNIYCLVITDLRMPIINGYRIINEFKLIKPDIKVILISAYNISQNDLINNLNPGIEVDRIILKPASLEDIKKEVMYFCDKN